MDSDKSFQTLWESYNAMFGVSSVIGSSLSAAAGYLQIAASIYVAVTAIMMILGQLTWAEGMHRTKRALVVIAVLAPTFYNKYVVEFATQTIPNEIATVITGADHQSTAVEVCDQLNNAAEALLAQTKSNAGMSPLNIPGLMSAYAATGVSEAAITVTFFVWCLAFWLVSVLLCILPLLLACWWFSFTRGLPERTISKLISMMVLMALSMIVTQIVHTQQRSYVAGFASAMVQMPANVPPRLGPRGGWKMTESMLLPDEPVLTPGMPSGGNFDQQVSLLWKVAMSFFFGACIMCLLPGIAAYIGGGVAIGVAPIIITAGRSAIGGRR